jgi:hypothetical protein
VRYAIFVRMLENVCDVSGFFACICEGGPFFIWFQWGSCMFVFGCGIFMWFDWE